MKIVKTDMEKVKSDMDRVKYDMEKVKSDLQIVKSFVIAADNSFNDYESRIKNLEKKTANL